MKLFIVFFLLNTVAVDAAFVPKVCTHSEKKLYGYLDDLSAELYQKGPQDKREDGYNSDNGRESPSQMKEEEKDRYGPGQWTDYVEFNEFDGGDGQMGVAGDGSGNKLEKIGSGSTPELAKSKMMSAKNAWGTTTGYADKLKEQGVETSRAQQLENWHNQQAVLRKKQQARDLTDNFDQVTYKEDENWRNLAKFGVERNQDFDLNDRFGSVKAETLDGVVELQSMIGKISYQEISVKNEYMGFADFRAAFTPETNKNDWTVEPMEGSLSKEPVNFIVKFKPNNPGTSEGFLVIETEDFKKTFKLIGSTS